MADLELYIFLQKNFDILVTFCMTAEKDGDMNGARVTRLADTVDNIYKRAILKFELGMVHHTPSSSLRKTARMVRIGDFLVELLVGEGPLISLL